MPISVSEKFESRSGSDEEIERIYTVSGTDDDAAARAAVASAAPLTYGLLVRQAPSLEPIGEQLWEAKVRYIKSELQPLASGDSSFSFDTTGGTQHITQSRQTMRSYSATTRPAPDFGGAIGVTHDNVEGVDITVPLFAFSVNRSIPKANMTAAYIAALYALTGKVNNAQFNVTVRGIPLSFATGECLFLGAVGGQRGSEDWEVTFKFAASPNASDLVVGSIDGIIKQGWEYLWVRYADAEDAAANEVVKRPVAAYVERVYDPSDFAVLGL